MLFANGVVRGYSYPLLQELYDVGPFDSESPVPTSGLASPIVPCRKLER